MTGVQQARGRVLRAGRGLHFSNYCNVFFLGISSTQFTFTYSSLISHVQSCQLLTIFFFLLCLASHRSCSAVERTTSKGCDGRRALLPFIVFPDCPSL